MTSSAAPAANIAALKASPLFAGFTDTGLAIFGGISTPRSYPQGTPLFAENMVSDAMLIIVDGTVTLSVKDGSGEHALGEAGPGDWLGELSLIAVGQRMCTATATTAVRAIEIRHADFQKTLALKPQACVKLLMAICKGFGEKVVENKPALRSLIHS